MDTANKRASALGRGLAFLTVYPIPDAAIDAGDRLQLAWLYRGYGDVPPPAVDTPDERTFSVLAQIRAFIVRAQSRTFEVR